MVEFWRKIGHSDVSGMYDSAYSMVDTMPTGSKEYNAWWSKEYERRNAYDL